MDAELLRTGTRRAYVDEHGGRWCEVYLDAHQSRRGKRSSFTASVSVAVARGLSSSPGVGTRS